VRDRVGAEEGPGQGSNGAEAGPGQGRGQAATGPGQGRGRGRSGTGLGPGQVRDKVEAEWPRQGPRQGQGRVRPCRDGVGATSGAAEGPCQGRLRAASGAA
ncbi:unnamed protein product, partial [Closterium sp. NIES-53]